MRPRIILNKVPRNGKPPETCQGADLLDTEAIYCSLMGVCGGGGAVTCKTIVPCWGQLTENITPGAKPQPTSQRPRKRTCDPRDDTNPSITLKVFGFMGRGLQRRLS